MFNFLNAFEIQSQPPVQRYQECLIKLMGMVIITRYERVLISLKLKVDDEMTVRHKIFRENYISI